jgi:hypothetical protein
MSKNTGTSELINYFDLGANGDVGIAGSLDINTIANATTDTDTFLVSDTGIIKYRTGAQLLSDIGAAPATGGSYLPLAGGILTGTTRMDGSGGTVPSITMIYNSGVNRLLAPLLRLYGATNESSNYIELFGSSATSNRTINFPDASGTVALTSQIPANPVGGTGASGTIPVFTGSTTIGNSIIQSNATQVNIVGNGSQLLFDSLGSAKDGGIQYVNDFTLQMFNSRGVGSSIYLGNNNLDLNINPSTNPRLRITSGGNVLINSTTDNGARLQVSGAATVSGTGYFGGATSASGLTGASELIVQNEIGIQNNDTIGPYLRMVMGGLNQNITFVTGAFSGTEPNLLFSVGGSTRLTLASTGAATFSGYSGAVNQNNGIKLTNNVGTIVGLEVGGSNDSYIGTISASNFSIRTANSPIITVTSSGNVGIGTPSPAKKLDVYENSTASVGQYIRNTTVNGLLQVDGTSNFQVGTETNHPLFLLTNNSTRVLITGSGNVLIGTTSNANGKLQVLGADNAVIAQIKSSLSMLQIYPYFSAYGGPIIQALDGGAVGYVPLRIEASSTTFNSSVNINGNIDLPSGANRSITLGSVTNYNYRLRTDGDDFVITEAGVTDRLRYSYTTVRWTITGGLTVSGSLSKGSGSFKIDHPLPEKKDTHQLVHSFIEGPKADLIYRGKLILINGKAQANIDEASTMTEGTFDVLCRDVQCFTTNETGWDLVKGKVVGNVIYIESQNTNSTDEISWMVIGERKDKHMIDTDWTDENGKVIVEPLKK